MRKPCAVSSLVQPNLERACRPCVLISDGVKLKRSAVISTTCSSPARRLRAAPAATAAAASERRDRAPRATSMRAHQNHHPRPTLNELGAAITALWLRTIDVVDLDGDVGVGPVGGADHPGVAIELAAAARSRPASGTACRSSRSARTRRRRRTRAPEIDAVAGLERSRRAASLAMFGLTPTRARQRVVQRRRRCRSHTCANWPRSSKPVAACSARRLRRACTGTSKRGRNSKPDLPAQTLAPAVSPRTPTYSRRPVDGGAADVGLGCPSAGLRACPLRR